MRSMTYSERGLKMRLMILNGTDNRKVILNKDLVVWIEPFRGYTEVEVGNSERYNRFYKVKETMEEVEELLESDEDMILDI